MSIRNAGEAITNRMTADSGRDTPRASGHCMCDLHIHMYRYDRAEVVLTLQVLRSIGFQSHAVESQFRKASKGTAIPLLHPALNSTVCCCFISVS
jgi:hypothetical protein